MNYNILSVASLYNKIIKSLVDSNRISIFDISKIETPNNYEELIFRVEKFGVDDYEVAELISDLCGFKMADTFVLEGGYRIGDYGYYYKGIFYSFNPLDLVHKIKNNTKIKLKGVREIGIIPKSFHPEFGGKYVKKADLQVEIAYDILQLINIAINENATEVIFSPAEGDNLHIKFKINNLIYDKKFIVPKFVSYKKIATLLGVKDGKNHIVINSEKVNKKVFFHTNNDILQVLKIKDNDVNQIDSLDFVVSSHLNSLKKTLNNRSGLVLISGLAGSGLSTLYYSLLSYAYSKFKDRKILMFDEEEQINNIKGVLSVDSLNSVSIDNAEILFLNIKNKFNLNFDKLKEIIDSGIIVYVFMNSQSLFSTLDFFVENIGGKEMSRDFISSLHIASVPKLCKSCSIDVMFGDYHNAHTLTTNVDSSPELSKTVKEKSIYGCSSCGGLGVEGTEILSEYLLPNKEFLKLFDDSFSGKAAYNFLKSDSWEFILFLALKEVQKGNISLKHVNEFVGRLIDTI